VRRRSRGADPVGALGAAGWLFAELAFVLVIVAFGADESPPIQQASTDPVSPVAAEPSAPVGLDLCSQTFRLPAARLVDPASSVAAFQEELQRLGLGPNVRAGLVLLFGVPRNGAPGGGGQESRALKAALEGAALPQLASAEIRPYIGTGDWGSVEVEIFVVTGDLDPAMPASSACGP